MTPVAAIFDVGKTNKKFLLFDEHYTPVFEIQEQLPETTDEDGFPCEDVHALTAWIRQTLNRAFAEKDFALKAINFSAYGASLVHLGAGGEVLTPLYNYLKPYPGLLQKKFFDSFGDVSADTASPALGSLNAGLQLYRLRHEQPLVFGQIRYSLHLPQYLGYILTGHACSELTSVGCHTALWDFQKGQYHDWVKAEQLESKLAPFRHANTVVSLSIGGHQVLCGTGLHDSSSAVIPYRCALAEPFVLISTGTWSISLNPFNTEPLTTYELKRDCLCYLTEEGVPVKAARLFAGHFHDEHVRQLAAHFHVAEQAFDSMPYRPEIAEQLPMFPAAAGQPGSFGAMRYLPQLDQMRSYEEAYHQLMRIIVHHQAMSTALVLGNSEVRQLIVDGGFSRNTIYMKLLADAFPGMTTRSARVPQASALGAALVIRMHWNDRPLPENLVSAV